MPGSVNIGGVWKQLAKAFVNIGGAWKQVTKGYCNVGGSWKEWYSGGVMYCLVGTTPLKYSELEMDTFTPSGAAITPFIADLGKAGFSGSSGCLFATSGSGILYKIDPNTYAQIAAKGYPDFNAAGVLGTETYLYTSNWNPNTSSSCRLIRIDSGSLSFLDAKNAHGTYPVGSGGNNNILLRYFSESGYVYITYLNESTLAELARSRPPSTAVLVTSLEGVGSKVYAYTDSTGAGHYFYELDSSNPQTVLRQQYVGSPYSQTYYMASPKT